MKTRRNFIATGGDEPPPVWIGISTADVDAHKIALGVAAINQAVG